MNNLKISILREEPGFSYSHFLKAVDKQTATFITGNNSLELFEKLFSMEDGAHDEKATKKFRDEFEKAKKAIVTPIGEPGWYTPFLVQTENENNIKEEAIVKAVEIYTWYCTLCNKDENWSVLDENCKHETAVRLYVEKEMDIAIEKHK